jgi:hypothetical protein
MTFYIFFNKKDHKNLDSYNIKTIQCGYDIARAIFLKVECSIILPAMRLTSNTTCIQTCIQCWRFRSILTGSGSNL